VCGRSADPTVHMDAKVIVSTYEELPPRRCRSISHSASAAGTRVPPTSSTPRQAAGYNRRALLLAYARQLRRRRVTELQQRGPPLLEWGEWKTTGSAGGDVAVRWANIFYVAMWLRARQIFITNARIADVHLLC
jgi:hypothetical protein